MCASTLCPFSSSTRNMALGNGSTTVPSTRIVSSLGLARAPTAYGLGCLGRAKRIPPTAGATTKCTRPPEPLRIRGLAPGSPGEGQPRGAIRRHRDRVLEVGRPAPVAGDDRPAVGQEL